MAFFACTASVSSRRMRTIISRMLFPQSHRPAAVHNSQCCPLSLSLTLPFFLAFRTVATDLPFAICTELQLLSGDCILRAWLPIDHQFGQQRVEPHSLALRAQQKKLKKGENTTTKKRRYRRRRSRETDFVSRSRSASLSRPALLLLATVFTHFLSSVMALWIRS